VNRCSIDCAASWCPHLSSRPRTQLEIPTRLRRLNSRARIYKQWYANHLRLGPSGSIMNRRAPTLHMPTSQPLYSKASLQSSPPEDHINLKVPGGTSFKRSSATLNPSGPIYTLSYSCKNVLMRTPSIDLSHSRFFAKPPNFSEQKHTLARRVSRPLPFPPMREEERRSRGGRSMIVQSSLTGMGWTYRIKLRSL